MKKGRKTFQENLIIHVRFSQKGKDSADLRFYGLTKKETVSLIQRVIDGQYLSLFSKGNETVINISAKIICEEVSRPEICRRLNITDKTYQNHRAHILKKAGEKTTIGCLYKFAIQSGLIIL